MEQDKEYIFSKIESMKTLDIMPIPLTQGLYALVDGKDFEQWKKEKK